jgi:thiol-disulfide isomerase/thioredoxin
LQGKVVLVDFWTYTCINWLRTLAYLRAWAEKYQDQGLVVVGVHTPEFPFERDVDNVRQAVKDMAVAYPVALDSDYAIWQAFANRFWPAVYIADAEGRIRHHQFGEGAYAECEMVIQRLLSDSGRDNVPRQLVSVAPDGFEAQADWASLKSPETYLGYERAHISQRCSPRPDPQLHRARPVESEPVGLCGGLDDRASGERTRPRWWPNPLPLPGPRCSPRHGTPAARYFRTVPRPHRW